jgi:hypothetical protein
MHEDIPDMWDGLRELRCIIIIAIIKTQDDETRVPSRASESGKVMDRMKILAPFQNGHQTLVITQFNTSKTMERG